MQHEQIKVESLYFSFVKITKIETFILLPDKRLLGTMTTVLYVAINSPMFLS